MDLVRIVSPGADKTAVPKRSAVRSEGLGNDNGPQIDGPGGVLERDRSGGVIKAALIAILHASRRQEPPFTKIQLTPVAV